MASDPNGWPDEARPGVPADWERDATWHWLESPGGDVAPWLYFRDSTDAGYWSRGYARDGVPLDEAGADYRYLGPCLLPADFAARVEQARAKALEEAAGVATSAREKALRGAAEEWGYPNSPDIRARLNSRAHEAGEIAAAIRALKESADG